jgi:hypothetical protein
MNFLGLFFGWPRMGGHRASQLYSVRLGYRAYAGQGRLYALARDCCLAN